MDGDGEASRRMVDVGSVTREAAMINPIMMRFRPIAPKPVAGGGSASAAPSVSIVRTKRNYVRVTRYNRKNKITRSSNTAGKSAVDHTVVKKTAERLQLLPERQTVEVWATVECVTDASSTEIMGVELGRTDEERKKNLEEDTCPGFVSDGENRVEWLNKAFIRMARQRMRRGSSGGEDAEGESPGVRLVIISELKKGLGFTCQIKLEFKMRGREMEKEVKLVPCDAWRMDGGGFAWKLDVKAALTLAPLLQEDFQ